MTTKTKKWTAQLIPPQSGRRVLITGGNSGIGFETTRELARRGAEIVLPARSMAKAKAAIERIRREIPSAVLIPAVLDLASQGSVHEFAAWFSEYYPGPSINLFIHNAGVMAIPKRELTVDGFERQFATNFLGPFALTALLYRRLRQESGNRIVIVRAQLPNGQRSTSITFRVSVATVQWPRHMVNRNSRTRCSLSNSTID